MKLCRKLTTLCSSCDSASSTCYRMRQADIDRIKSQQAEFARTIKKLLKNNPSGEHLHLSMLIEEQNASIVHLKKALRATRTSCGDLIQNTAIDQLGIQIDAGTHTIKIVDRKKFNKALAKAAEAAIKAAL